MGISSDPRLPVWRNKITTNGKALGREDGRRRCTFTDRSRSAATLRQKSVNSPSRSRADDVERRWSNTLGWATHHTQNVEEQVDKVEVERQRAEDRLVDGKPLHDLLGVVEHERGEEEDAETRDDKVDSGVEGEEYLDERGGDEAPDGGEEEGREGGEVELSGRVSRDSEGDMRQAGRRRDRKKRIER